MTLKEKLKLFAPLIFFIYLILFFIAVLWIVGTTEHYMNKKNCGDKHEKFEYIGFDEENTYYNCCKSTFKIENGIYVKDEICRPHEKMNG